MKVSSWCCSACPGGLRSPWTGAALADRGTLKGELVVPRNPVDKQLTGPRPTVTLQAQMDTIGNEPSPSSGTVSRAPVARPVAPTRGNTGMGAPFRHKATGHGHDGSPRLTAG